MIKEADAKSFQTLMDKQMILAATGKGPEKWC